MKRYLLGILVAACGGEGVSSTVEPPIDRCGTTGNATVKGYTMGESIGPIARAFYFEASGKVGIWISETAGEKSACDFAPAAASGKVISLAFCDAVAVGHYDTAAQANFMCPGSAPVGEVGDVATTERTADALGGSIDITNADDECVEGTFSLDFASGGTADDTLTGSFSAINCVE